jgi:hypothetical protein
MLAVCEGNSDNTMIQGIYGWEPSIRLADGLIRTYHCVYDQLSERGNARAAV